MDLKNSVMQMVESNNSAPDIEQLERHEFNLDAEKRQQMVAVGEEKIKQVRWD